MPTAEVTTECEGEAGGIVVNIFDETSEEYDVFIDGALVATGVTDTDEGTEPLVYESPDGVFNVVVHWIDGEIDILDEDVTVACGPEETTTTTTTPPPPAEPGVEAVVADPDYTG